MTIRPGKLQIDYEVSLTELTLHAEPTHLDRIASGCGSVDWLARYGQVTGPLNAKGFLASCNGLPVDLAFKTFKLVVEEHPRYTFHL